MLTGVLSDSYSIDTIEWVKPTLPTVLGDLKRLGLAPTDLSFACVSTRLKLDCVPTVTFMQPVVATSHYLSWSPRQIQVHSQLRVCPLSIRTFIRATPLHRWPMVH